MNTYEGLSTGNADTQLRNYHSNKYTHHPDVFSSTRHHHAQEPTVAKKESK
jgi:hypothetical protein